MDSRAMELRTKQWIPIIEEQVKNGAAKGNGVQCMTLTAPLFSMTKTSQCISSRSMGKSDLRKGIDGLAAMVRLKYGLDSLEKIPYSSSAVSGAIGSRNYYGLGISSFFYISNWLMDFSNGQGQHRKSEVLAQILLNAEDMENEETIIESIISSLAERHNL